MGNPLLRREDPEDGEDDFLHQKSFDDHVNGLPTAVTFSPTGVPSNVDSDIDSDMGRPTDIPSQYHPPFQWTRSSKGRETLTVISSVTFPPYSDNAQSPPTPVQSTTSAFSTTFNNGGGGHGDPSTWDDEKGPSHKVMPAVAGATSVVVVAIIGFIILFCVRKRKRQRQQQASRAQMQEMKARAQPSMQAHIGASPIYAQYAIPPSHSPPATLAPLPPVILGPISPGSNGAYYTGIDTSDIVSMHDRNGLGNPFADGDSLNEEPPPPYRPRSLAPMSRNTSLRTTLTDTSQTNLIQGHDPSVRSPFADPRDDDDISDISGPTLRGNHDSISVVTDMSYQEDPVVVRPTV